MKKIIRKCENEMTLNELIELIDQKYLKKEKIFYEEFILLSLVYDNVYFVYHQTEYQIDRGLPDITSLFIIEHSKKLNKELKKEEKYCSVFELFNEVRINGKTIKEVWEDVTF